jgi:hypothetical protein
MNKLKLFATAFLQVFLVSANTYFISQTFWVGIAIAGFGISWFWSGNVQKVGFGDKIDRLIYSIGATLGGITGVLISKMIL